MVGGLSAGWKLVPKDVIDSEGLEEPIKAWLVSLMTGTSVQIKEVVLRWAFTFFRWFGWRRLREVSQQDFQAENF